MSIGPRRLGKYELQHRLGHGGMAEVWKALDTQLQRYVALKFLHASLRADPEFRMRFVREAQVMASLRHPNIVQLHDFHTADPAEVEADDVLVYMVMDYVEGMTLAEYIRDTSRVGKFPPAREIVHLFTAIGSAVDYAHQRGLIHRDIKPANIFLDHRQPSHYHMGEPILADFGIVKLTGATSTTMIGWFGGTPSYISPEQAQSLPVTGSSDIYSLGVVLYELCTGVRPFQGENPSAVILQHIAVLPPPPHLLNPQLPPALSEVILRSLAKDPAARFPSAMAMAEQLAEALNVALPLHAPADTSGRVLYNTPPQLNTSPSPASLTPLLPSISSLSPSVVSPSTRPFDKGTPLPHGLHTPQSDSMVPAVLHPDGTPLEQDASQPLTEPSFAESPSCSSAPAHPSPPTGHKKVVLILSLVLVLLVMTSTILSAVYLRSHLAPTPRPTANTIAQSIGQASFQSSALLNQQANRGIGDELHIVLAHIQSPSAGKHYYAWLLTDISQEPMQALPLGPLSVNTGRVEFVYKDSQQVNLLTSYSRFLITEDSTPVPPSSASRSTWRYYAELPQIPSGMYNGASALDYLRQLLAPGSPSQTPVGLVPQFLRNTEQIWEWSKTLKTFRNNGDAAALRQQSIRILAYLDGSFYIDEDVPTGTQLGVDPARIQVPMVFVIDPQPHSPYSWAIHNQIAGLLQAPGITPKMQQSATQADKALDSMVHWLQAVHDDAKQLVQMNDAQLLQPNTLTLLGHLETQANYAYNGRTDTSFQGGIAWIYQSIQNAATFEVQPHGANG